MSGWHAHPGRTDKTLGSSTEAAPARRRLGVGGVGHGVLPGGNQSILENTEF